MWKKLDEDKNVQEAPPVQEEGACGPSEPPPTPNQPGTSDNGVKKKIRKFPSLGFGRLLGKMSRSIALFLTKIPSSGITKSVDRSDWYPVIAGRDAAHDQRLEDVIAEMKKIARKAERMEEIRLKKGTEAEELLPRSEDTSSCSYSGSLRRSDTETSELLLSDVQDSIQGSSRSSMQRSKSYDPNVFRPIEYRRPPKPAKPAKEDEQKK